MLPPPPRKHKRLYSELSVYCDCLWFTRKLLFSFYLLQQIEIHKPNMSNTLRYEDSLDKCIITTHGRDCQFRNGYCKKTNNLCSWELFPRAYHRTNCVQNVWKCVIYCLHVILKHFINDNGNISYTHLTMPSCFIIISIS